MISRPAMAWSVLGAGVAAYDILCPPGDTLSEGVDHAMERPIGRALAVGAIVVTAAHLANAIPERYDPFSRLLRFKEVAAIACDDAMDCWGDE